MPVIFRSVAANYSAGFTPPPFDVYENPLLNRGIEMCIYLKNRVSRNG